MASIATYTNPELIQQLSKYSGSLEMLHDYSTIQQVLGHPEADLAPRVAQYLLKRRVLLTNQERFRGQVSLQNIPYAGDGQWANPCIYPLFAPKMPPLIRWSVQIVRPESATTLGYLRVEAIPLHENHINMVKFSSMEGQGFQEISEQLQKMAKDVLK